MAGVNFSSAIIKYMRTILTVFAGRQRYLTILKDYLNVLLDRGYLTEVHLWNYARNDDDYKYVETLATSREEYVLFTPDKADIHKGWNQWSMYYDHYISASYAVDDIIIKCDDDVVYIDVERFPLFITEVHDDAVFFPNIINNDVGAYIQSQNKVHRFLTKVDPRMMNIGCDVPLTTWATLWAADPVKARAAHIHFLGNRSQYVLDIPVMKWYSRISINFFAMTFKTVVRYFELFKEFGGGDDEAWFSARVIKRTGNPNVIVPYFNVVHFSFGGQWSEELDAEFLTKYQELFDKESKLTTAT
jgi:hypothetical protein